MKRKLEISELIFKIISYTCLTVFALCCLYPFVYAISASISGRDAVEYSRVVLFPQDIQFEAFAEMFNNNMFWNSYTNTLFLTFYGTIWALFFSILGGYALSKKRLLFRRFFNFFLVFTMWFSAGIVPQYLNYLDVIQNIGMARIDPIMYNGMEIVPIQFLKAVLPDPKTLGENYHGETSIGCRIRGIKDGKEKTYYIYNNCDHAEAYKETGTQAVSYTTGVPAALGAAMFAKGLWVMPGVHNVEEFDPDPFLAELCPQVLGWVEVHDVDLEL